MTLEQTFAGWFPGTSKDIVPGDCKFSVKMCNTWIKKIIIMTVQHHFNRTIGLLSQQKQHVYSTLKRRGNDRFHVVLTWKTLLISSYPLLDTRHKLNIPKNLQDVFWFIKPYYSNKKTDILFIYLFFFKYWIMEPTYGKRFSFTVCKDIIQRSLSNIFSACYVSITRFDSFTACNDII